MKIVKIGFLALSLGFFMASCGNNGNSSSTTSDTTTTMTTTPPDTAMAPAANTMPDTMNNGMNNNTGANGMSSDTLRK